ncbi:MAG: hypothetical protein HOD03_06440 [Planctomycetes bacterium]|jgi:hypothetical protein|nr:hypothetical protein [Planctomycetota bacterium]
MRLLLLPLLMCWSCSTAQTSQQSSSAEEAQWLVREMQFMFPQHLAEVKRSVQRAHLAQLRSADLGLSIDDNLVEQEFASIVQQLKASTPGSLNDLAEAEYQMSWEEIAANYRQHLKANLLYRSLYVADAQQLRKLKVAVLANHQLSVVDRWRDQLELGRRPEGFGADVIDLPEWRTEVYAPGSIVGPFRAANGLYMIGMVDSVAPSAGEAEWSEIQRIAATYDISPFAAEVWIHEMAIRYTIGD